MWTTENRAKYARDKLRYPSDLIRLASIRLMLRRVCSPA